MYIHHKSNNSCKVIRHAINILNILSIFRYDNFVSDRDFVSVSMKYLTIGD